LSDRRRQVATGAGDHSVFPNPNIVEGVSMSVLLTKRDESGS
jgi:hypothetical protein